MRSKPIVAASSFTANVNRLVEVLEYRTIESDADLDAVLKLRYDAYLKEGAITPNESRRLGDNFDHLGNAVNVGIFHEGKLVSALRIHFLSDPNDDSPSMEVFSDVLRPHLEAGKRLVDPNRFVLDYATARRFPHLAYATVRLSVMASAYYSAHLSIATIRVEHQAFYKRTFFATPTAPARSYPLLTKKISLMLVDYEKDQHRIVERSPFYESTRAEQERLFGKIKIPNALQSAA
ncbi:MAG: N-acyl amino acid synthase FeeM domain-containing protein [Methylovirgula sp.]